MTRNTNRRSILGILAAGIAAASAPSASAGKRKRRQTISEAALRRALRKLWNGNESICEERCHDDGTSCLQQCYAVETAIERIIKAAS